MSVCDELRTYLRNFQSGLASNANSPVQASSTPPSPPPPSSSGQEQQDVCSSSLMTNKAFGVFMPASVCSEQLNLGSSSGNGDYVLPFLLLDSNNVTANSLLCNVNFTHSGAAVPDVTFDIHSVSDCSSATFIDYHNSTVESDFFSRIKLLQYSRSNLTWPGNSGNGECSSFNRTYNLTGSAEFESRFKVDQESGVTTGTFYFIEATNTDNPHLWFQENNTESLYVYLAPAISDRITEGIEVYGANPLTAATINSTLCDVRTECGVCNDTLYTWLPFP